ncbi:MAG: hypothetical protein Q4E24_10230 [bacterium]|nr:hypothetical protein [bacterium]
MEKVTFYSYKPYLTLGLCREDGIIITFSAECTYSPTNEVQLELLRKYAEDTKNSYIISESMAPEELRRRYTELEEKAVQEAEARAAAKAEEEDRKRWEHEFFSALRFSDQLCR